MDSEKLTEQAKALRAAYQRQWRAANKDRVQKHLENYWLKKAAQRAQETATN